MSDTITGHQWAEGEACRVVRLNPDGTPRQGKDAEAYDAVVTRLTRRIVRNELDGFLAALSGGRPDWVGAEIATEYGPRTRCFCYRTGYDDDALRFYRLVPAGQEA
jgi:hypothetical protein